MDRKGAYIATQKAIFFLFALFILIGVILAMAWLFTVYRTYPVQVDDTVYVAIYTERLLGSPDCFAYTDPATNVTYQGIVDVRKFTGDRLDACYRPNDESPYEFFLTLQYSGQELKIRTQNFRQLSKQTPQYVLVYDGNRMTTGTLTVGVGGLSG